MGVVLLTDFRTIFYQLGVDRLSSAALVNMLHEFNDGAWSEWCGQNHDRLPHKLTQNELAGLLKPFGIRSKTVWPLHRQLGDRSDRGYVRSDLETAWQRYCRLSDTTTQRSKIKY